MDEHYPNEDSFNKLSGATPRPALEPKGNGNIRAFIFGVAVTLIAVLLALAFDNAIARADHAASCARIMGAM